MLRLTEDSDTGTPAPKDRRTDVAALNSNYTAERLRIVVTGVDITKRTGGAIATVKLPHDTLSVWLPIGFTIPFGVFSETRPHYSCPTAGHHVDRSGNTVTIVLPTSCLSSATKVRVGGGLTSGRLSGDTFYADDALSPTIDPVADDVTLSPWVRRG